MIGGMSRAAEEVDHETLSTTPTFNTQCSTFRLPSWLPHNHQHHARSPVATGPASQNTSVASQAPAVSVPIRRILHPHQCCIYQSNAPQAASVNHHHQSATHTPGTYTASELSPTDENSTPTTTIPILLARATDAARSIDSQNRIGGAIIGSIVGAFALAVFGVLVYSACTKKLNGGGSERADAEAVSPGGAGLRVVEGRE